MRFDPRTKLLVVLLITSLAIILNNLWFLISIIILEILLSLIFTNNLFNIFLKLKKVLPFFLMIIVLQCIFIRSGVPIAKINNFVLITDQGLVKGISFLIRMCIIILSASILSTSNTREIIQGLIQLGMPYELAFMTSLALRFLPLLKEEVSDTFRAIQLRGINLKEISLKEKMNVYTYIFTPIIVNVLEKSKKLSASLELKGFRKNAQRTSYFILEFQSKDYLLCIIMFVIFTVYIFVYYFNI